MGTGEVMPFMEVKRYCFGFIVEMTNSSDILLMYGKSLVYNY
jgi:hypothetical protein